jgi:anti-anti-sigma regulatory factor
MMLRISKASTTHEYTTLRLEGSISGAWVDELRRLTDAVLAETTNVVIDCCGVSFSDHQGQQLMRELLARKVTLINCSPFFQSQLDAVQ